MPRRLPAAFARKCRGPPMSSPDDPPPLLLSLDEPEDRPRGEDGVPRVWQPGDILLDLYVVRGALGEGTTGTVWKVWHRKWWQFLAVRSATPSILAVAAAVECF